MPSLRSSVVTTRERKYFEIIYEFNFEDGNGDCTYIYITKTHLSISSEKGLTFCSFKDMNKINVTVTKKIITVMDTLISPPPTSNGLVGIGA